MAKTDKIAKNKFLLGKMYFQSINIKKFEPEKITEINLNVW